MKYRYLYQTKDNENREGEISAKNRAEAYAALRKRGIRPYRVIGDDPPDWQPAAAAAAFALAVAAAVAAFFIGAGREDFGPLRRGQLEGDRAAISKGLETCWEGSLASPLDRFLAAYAQPGWLAIPPDAVEGGMDALAAELSRPQDFPSDDPPEVRRLRRIVASMRSEFASFLEAGGTPDEYARFLEARQDEEAAFRRQAADTVAAAPDDAKLRVRAAMNIRLREMGLPEID